MSQKRSYLLAYPPFVAFQDCSIIVRGYEDMQHEERHGYVRMSPILCRRFARFTLK